MQQVRAYIVKRRIKHASHPSCFLTICRKPQQGHSDSNDNNGILLDSLTLNGKPLLQDAIVLSDNSTCSTVLLHVPSRATSEKFVFTSRMVLANNGQRWGVGADSRVQVVFGNVHVL